jgi:cell division protein ZapA
MSQVTIEIGGRNFEVVCQEGEEEYLHAAAAMLDEEAKKLDGGGARVTESRMLLMSGLLLADRTAATEEKLKSFSAPAATADPETADRARDAEAKLRAAEVDMTALKAQLSEAQSNVSAGNSDQDELIEQLKSERDQAVKTLQQIVGKVQGLAAAQD